MYVCRYNYINVIRWLNKNGGFSSDWGKDSDYKHILYVYTYIPTVHVHTYMYVHVHTRTLYMYSIHNYITQNTQEVQ